MRLVPEPEFATLGQATETTRGSSNCRAPVGSKLQLLGWPTSLAEPGRRSRMAVRVRGGACDGFEATVEEDQLLDRRPTVEPQVQPKAKTPPGASLPTK